MSSSADLNDDARFFAPGAKYKIGMVLAVLAVFAWAVFGWAGVAAVLSVPLLALLGAALTFAFIILVIWSVVNNIEDGLPDEGDGEQ